MRGSQVYRDGPGALRGPARGLKLAQSPFEQSADPVFQNNAFQAGAFQMGEATFVDPVKVPGLMTARAVRDVTFAERG